jgi:LEA14-like dessication related protein
MRRFIPIVLMIVAISSCRQPKDLVYRDIEQVKVSDSMVSFWVRMYNPNRFRMFLKEADMDISLNNTSLGSVHIPGYVKIARKDTFSMIVLYQPKMKDLLPGAVSLLLSNEVTLRLKGVAKVGRRGLYTTMPLDYESRFDLSSLLGR